MIKKNLHNNMLWGALGFVLPTVVVLMSYPILLNEIGKETFGIFVLATTVASTFAFLDFGTTTIIVRVVSQGGSRRENINTTTSIIAYNLVVQTCVLVLGCIFSNDIIKVLFPSREITRESGEIICLAFMQSYLLSLTSLSIAISKGCANFRIATIISTSQSTFSNIALLVGAFWTGKLSDMMLYSNFVLCIIFAGCLAPTKNMLKTQGISPAFETFFMRDLWSTLKTSAPLSINTLSGIVLYQSQRYAAGLLINPSAVTIYFLPFALASKIHGVVNAATEVLYPFACNNIANRHFVEIYISIARKTIFLAVLVMVTVLLLANEILTIWLGSELSDDSAELLRILVVGFCALATTPPPFHLLNGMNKSISTVWLSIANAVVCVISILFFFLLTNELALKHLAWSFTLSSTLTAIAYHLLALTFLRCNKLQK